MLPNSSSPNAQFNFVTHGEFSTAVCHTLLVHTSPLDGRVCISRGVVPTVGNSEQLPMQGGSN